LFIYKRTAFVCFFARTRSNWFHTDTTK